MRGIVHEKFLDVCNNIVKIKLITIWPNKNERLERKIKNVIDSFELFIKTIIEHSETRGEYLKPVQFYKTGGQINPNYDRDLQLFKDWQQLCFNTLNNYVFFLNELIKYINKIYDIDDTKLQNQYLMDDNFGIFDPNLVPGSYLPLKKKKCT